MVSKQVAEVKRVAAEQLERVKEQAAKEVEEAQRMVAAMEAKLAQLETQRDLMEKELRDQVTELSNKLQQEKETASATETALVKLTKVHEGTKKMVGILQSTTDVQTLYDSVIQMKQDMQDLRERVQGDQGVLNGMMEQLGVQLEERYSQMDTHMKTCHRQLSVMRDEIQNIKGNYRVMMRTRPVIPAIDQCTSSAIQILSEYTVGITGENCGRREYAYDRVFSPSASQQDVFTEVEPLVMSIFRDMNACVLAYGQTGSGKTYTMMGEDGKEGMMSRSCNVIFQEMAYRQNAGLMLKVE